MTFRGQYVIRCPDCRVEAIRCVCALVPELALRTRVLVVMHTREVDKTTNGGCFLPRMSSRARIVVRGAPYAVPESLAAEDAEPALVLHPDAERELTEADGRVPRTLLVPDGTWTQTRRMLRRDPGFEGAERVRLPADRERRTAYRLRYDAREGHLSTLEAVGIALGLLEGPAIEAAIHAFYDAFVERTLLSRGKLRYDRERGLVPVDGFGDA